VTEVPDVDAPPTVCIDLSEDNLASLVDAFAALVPEDFERKFSDDPVTYAEAMASPHAAQWRAALQEEFDSLKYTGTYSLIPRSDVPRGHCIMQGRPVFKLKHDEKGHPACFKA
jgi:hypothetical protein